MNFSSRLTQLIGRDHLSHLHDEVSLLSLADELCQTEAVPWPSWVNRDALPTMQGIVLLKHLHEIARHDSCVQDICTSGHLGKLLIRWDIWVRCKSYELLGVPNRRLDALSKRDRVEFFATGTSLNLLTVEGLLKEVNELLDREKDWSR